VRQVADRLEVDIAILHLGAVRFPRYSMTARDAIKLCHLVRPRTAIPVHYEGGLTSRRGAEGSMTTSRWGKKRSAESSGCCPSAPRSEFLRNVLRRTELASRCR